MRFASIGAMLALVSATASAGMVNSLAFVSVPTLDDLGLFALIGLVVNLISDLTYTWIDPRIDFETREV